MKRFVHISAWVFALFIATSSWAQGPLQIGDKAPEFPRPLPSTAGEKPGEVQVQLSDFLGKGNIVLAFYVADWSGG